MLAFTSRSASFGVRAALSISISISISISAFAVVAAAMTGGGGCTLLVGDQLSDKPSEGAGGAGGQGGGSSTASQSSSAAQSSSSSSSSSGMGGLVCKPDTANCNGFLLDGCEAKLQSDPKNCGACKKVCQIGKPCKDGKCE
jgi:hypothetical protein